MVVVLIAVDVVNMLARKKLAANLLLSNNTMLVSAVVFPVGAWLHDCHTGKLCLAAALAPLFFGRDILMISMAANALGVHAAVPMPTF